MFDDALREALSATRDSWQAVDDEFPGSDPDLKAQILEAVDDAVNELEGALRLAGMGVPE